MTKNIVTWLEKNLGPSKTSHAGAELAVCCPFCDDDKYHLYYNQVKDVWNCFKCNSSGRGLDLIISVTGMDAYTAAKFLSPGKPILPQPVRELSEMPSWYSPLIPKPLVPKPGFDAVYNYALQRKFTTAQIEFYGFGYAIGDYTNRARLIIPVERGYYQARAISKLQVPKYLNPDVSKSDRLFNYRFLGCKRIAVCEGVISAIAATKDDCPALAVLGKSVTDEQRKRIADSKPEVVEIAFDAGTEKSDTTLDFAKYLHSRGITVIIRSYAWGDPDENREGYDTYTYTPSWALRARLDRVKVHYASIR